jgi:hypothetical protein
MMRHNNDYRHQWTLLWKYVLISLVIGFVMGNGLNWLAFFNQGIQQKQGDLQMKAKYNSSLEAPRPNLDFSRNIAVTINPGELPGYTGWARPEKTLAQYFTVQNISRVSPQANRPFLLQIQCQGHDNCNDDSAKFYLRAYGPAVIPGIVVKDQAASVENNIPGIYNVQFVFHDPGQYTVEIVLTFSSSPSIDSFPVKDRAQQPAYEGYLLPGFPLLLTVEQPDEPSPPPSIDTNSTCNFDAWTVSSHRDAIEKAQWVVTSRSNGPGYTSEHIDDSIAQQRHFEYVNSIGIKMKYQHLSHCKMLPASAFDPAIQDQRVFSDAQCPNMRNERRLRIIYIGDSLARIQYEKMQEFTVGLTNVELHYLTLHGGYRMNQIKGPSNVQAFLENFRRDYYNDTKVILFNTGLHDIHQLCDARMDVSRRQFLNTSVLDSGTYQCIAEYRAILQDFVGLIQNFPADLKVFQTSTAAWPKYGNWGIEWDNTVQAMPLVSDFCERFNEIAFEVLQEMNQRKNNDMDKIHVMDGYWITYARPDNREFGSTGKKLAHPGEEVVSAMTRIWSQMIVDKMC